MNCWFLAAPLSPNIQQTSAYLRTGKHHPETEAPLLC